MRAKILAFTPENIQKAAQAIQDGSVVGMPTETVYGLAGDSRSTLALTRIFEVKERPRFDPLIIHLADTGAATKTLTELERLKLIDGTQLPNQLQQMAHKLMKQFWPGPLTLVLPKHPEVPELATSGLPTIALRMPSHPVAQALLQASKCPLAAPSANRFGRISPTTSLAVAEELGDRIDWILEGGASLIGVESTVVALKPTGEILLLRHGGTPLEKIEAALGFPLLVPTKSQTLLGPGMTESHYSPSKPFRILPKDVSQLHLSDLTEIYSVLDTVSPQTQMGLLTLSGDPQLKANLLKKILHRPVIATSLSLTGDLSEAAQQLFAKMRWLDASEAAILYCEPCLTQKGLGYAIHDRLTRASARGESIN